MVPKSTSATSCIGLCRICGAGGGGRQGGCGGSRQAAGGARLLSPARAHLALDEGEERAAGVLEVRVHRGPDVQQEHHQLLAAHRRRHLRSQLIRAAGGGAACWTPRWRGCRCCCEAAASAQPRCDRRCYGRCYLAARRGSRRSPQRERAQRAARPGRALSGAVLQRCAMQPRGSLHLRSTARVSRVAWDGAWDGAPRGRFNAAFVCACRRRAPCCRCYRCRGGRSQLRVQAAAGPAAKQATRPAQHSTHQHHLLCAGAGMAASLPPNPSCGRRPGPASGRRPAQGGAVHASRRCRQAVAMITTVRSTHQQLWSAAPGASWRLHTPAACMRSNRAGAA